MHPAEGRAELRPDRARRGHVPAHPRLEDARERPPVHEFHRDEGQTVRQLPIADVADAVRAARELLEDLDLSDEALEPLLGMLMRHFDGAGRALGRSRLEHPREASGRQVPSDRETARQRMPDEVAGRHGLSIPLPSAACGHTPSPPPVNRAPRRALLRPERPVEERRALPQRPGQIAHQHLHPRRVAQRRMGQDPELHRHAG